ncbi:hypothetical protein NUW54_g1375 [Trametes sanguinea]|uniref:Uncharacterized protein n=1 Tax=Trametes sanguinea TaxID=158606 RepID=A0ACC1QAC1_9APHY|nr:hypothetical protein NUW54_g1375 [Trametes sanguinea]
MPVCSRAVMQQQGHPVHLRLLPSLSIEQTVAKKVKPVLAPLPDQFRIICDIKSDLLADIPSLPTHPPPFELTGCYTKEWRQALDALHLDGFLWLQERALLHHLVAQQNKVFLWNDSECGQFCEDFFLPVSIPIVQHTPWVQKNTPILPGLFDEVCNIIWKKEAVGVYEPSNSFHRSHWFCVLKKNGKSLHIVHLLELLHAVTITHSGIPPFTEQLTELFAGHACGGILDLYVRYNEQRFDPASRDLITFSTLFGGQCLTTLPMGWANSVPIFHDDITHILQPEIPDCETIPENDGIQCFVWEHLQNGNHIVQRVKYCGGTFSGTKSVLCVNKFTIVGHHCTYAGRVLELGNYDKVLNWGPCRSLLEVLVFLGTAGIAWAFIPNFGKHA